MTRQRRNEIIRALERLRAGDLDTPIHPMLASLLAKHNNDLNSLYRAGTQSLMRGLRRAKFSRDRSFSTRDAQKAFATNNTY